MLLTNFRDDRFWLQNYMIYSDILRFSDALAELFLIPNYEHDFNTFVTKYN